MNTYRALVEMARRPWAVTHETMEAAIALVSRGSALLVDGDQVRPPIVAELSRRRPSALAVERGVRLAGTRGVWLINGVARIEVAGALFKKANAFDSLCADVTSYEQLMMDVKAAARSPLVRAIMLVVDSPGGEVAGIAELADLIWKVRQVKTVATFVDGMAASGGLWIGTASGRVVSTPVGLHGSIGVRWGYLDSSEAERRAGIVRVEIVSDQSPFKAFDPADKDDRARAQRVVNDLAEVFISRMALYRGVDTKTVIERFGRGDVMAAARALEVGLIDAIGTEEELLAELAGPPPRAARSEAMNENCAGCGQTIAEGDPCYCKNCYDGGHGGASNGGGETAARTVLEGLSAKARITLGLDASAKPGDLSAAIERLAARVAQLDGEAIDREVDAAIAAFKYTAAERAYQIELAHENLERWRRETARRIPLPINADASIGDKPRTMDGGRTARQHEAVATALAADPNMGYAAAIVAAAQANPELFNDLKEDFNARP